LKQSGDAKALHAMRDQINWWKAVCACHGKALRTAPRSELISSFTIIERFLHFPVPVTAQCRLAQLNWEYCLNKREWQQAALTIKIWLVASERAQVTEFSSLSVGALLNKQLFQDEKLVVARLVPVMFFQQCGISSFRGRH
jgi:hypothetical protein